MKFILIVVSPSGETRLETHGFAGDACREASRFLEQALGATTSEKLTSDFHQAHAQSLNHLEQEP